MADMKAGFEGAFGMGKPVNVQAFKDFWSSGDNSSQTPLENAFLNFAYKGSLAIIAIILAIIIALVSALIYKRSEEGMADLLAEKGASLLNVFESALRAGMRGGAGLQLQPLLNEFARGPDIEFVAVVMPDGTIIAHSNLDRIGEVMELEHEALTVARVDELGPGKQEKWRVVQAEGLRVFLIYRHFMLDDKPRNKDLPEPIIFLGLEISPFEITSGQTRSYVAILAIVTMFLVLCGLLALSMAQKAAESRKLQKDAEGEVSRLTAEMRRKEKLAAVGTLAAGVAHEIRNPLSSIKGYATYFKQKSPEGSADREAANVMVQEVDRLNRVVTDLLGLSRPDDAKLKPVRLDYVIEHVSRLIRHQVTSKNITLKTDIPHHSPVAMGDMERLSQALLNMCLNAIDAMPNGGELEIAASGGKTRACLVVRDTGHGIGQDIISRIFDPYFTTKGSGTGLGLPMVYKVVKAHNGDIDVKSKVADENGPGWTVIRIWLPLAPKSKNDASANSEGANERLGARFADYGVASASNRSAV